VFDPFPSCFPKTSRKPHAADRQIPGDGDTGRRAAISRSSHNEAYASIHFLPKGAKVIGAANVWPARRDRPKPPGRITSGVYTVETGTSRASWTTRSSNRQAQEARARGSLWTERSRLWFARKDDPIMFTPGSAESPLPLARKRDNLILVHSGGGRMASSVTSPVTDKRRGLAAHVGVPCHLPVEGIGWKHHHERKVKITRLTPTLRKLRRDDEIAVPLRSVNWGYLLS